MGKKCEKCKEREQADAAERLEKDTATFAGLDEDIRKIQESTDRAIRQMEQRKVAGLLRADAERMMFRKYPFSCHRVEAHTAVQMAAVALYIGGLVIDSEERPAEYKLRNGVIHWYCDFLGYSEEEINRVVEVILPAIMAAEAEQKARHKRTMDELKAKSS